MGNCFAFSVNRLNELEARNKRYFVYDEKQPGLRLYVTPSGTKTFQFQVRSKSLNKIVTQTLGKYPALGPKEAKDQAAALLTDVNAGINIEVRKRDERRKRLLDPTVRQFSVEYIEKYSKVKKRTWKEDQRILNKDILPELGNLRMNEVKKRDIVAVLDKIEDRGALIMCNRVLAVLSKMFGFALERDVIEVFPIYGIKKRGKELSRDRILSDAEIKMLWEVLGNTPANMLLKFLLVTGQRTGETRLMEWAEVGENLWTIPGSKTKNGLTHIVPLSEMATDILDQMKQVSKEKYVFPGRVVGRRGIKGEKCLDKDIAAHHFRKVIKSFGWERTTVHDLRRTMRSNLAKLKVIEIVAEKILNHKIQGISGVYNRHSYLDEKDIALQKWSNKLQEILSDGKNKRSNVVDIKTRKAV